MDIDYVQQEASIMTVDDDTYQPVQRYQPYGLSMAHMLDFVTANSFADSRSGRQKSASVSLIKSSSTHSFTDSPDKNVDDNDNNSQNENQSNQSDPIKKFPLPTMTEWPGQTEGNPMDLEHFWKVISQYYPEDFPPDWADYMKKPFIDMKLHNDNDPCYILPEFCVPIDALTFQ